MYWKVLPLAISISMMTHAALADIQKQQIMSNINPSSAKVTAYWTPKRMQQAEPMDLPRVMAGSLKEISKVELLNQAEGHIGDGNDGSPPTIEIAPRLESIFEPIIHEIAKKVPLDTGTLNQPFTSMQLTPSTIDTSFPYRTVGKLFFTTPSGNKTCSASVINKRIILTAGHCVHSGLPNGWFSNFMFIPAYKNGAAPFQTWNISYMSVMTAWAVGGGTVPNPTDYGMLEVVDNTINGSLQSIGNVVGYLGWQINATIPNHAHILGYSSNFDSGNMMHLVTAESAKAVDANNVEYGSDMTVGAGGSPWIQNFGNASTGQTGGSNAGRNRVIGTSSYAYNNTTSLSNGGSVFDNNFVSLLNFICGHQIGNC